MKEAQIAILDEPTSGLDPQATLELLDIIRDLKHRGVSVLLSSHLLDRVQSVCDRVALFNEGNIALIGTVPELGRQVLGGGFRVEVEAEGQGLAERLAPVPGVQTVEPAGREPLAAALRPRRAAGSGGRGGRGRRAAAAPVGRGAEPRGDLHPLLRDPRGRASCGVKARPCTASGS